MKISQFYSKKVLQHFYHPKNVGEIKNPDGVATVGNPVCGDVLQLFIKIGKKGNKEFIKEAKFLTLGCAAALATSSMITTMVKGKPLSEAEKITNQAIAEALGGLPKNKLHCSVLAAEALEKAIVNYRQKTKK
ncbi:iron-sulfur cluster assembly scaffold protein [Candidatus Woesebacteria bacterium CG_4_10_14_0_2_um_filter_39_14]|uniref:Iron-sulfur cluster assembly scaffold protein n=3 Tax=Microgenomates group TaxID=1794810 RepID=A0A2M6YPJ2_9BACT|nr:MAG: iron-sulfur cluster assembly scaffold protein [Candidatus Shapirobacteria bacterium CG07_land_8_20_14_0_80_39_12]PIZ48819.1 MAG: iron-sulfur cluster assembly scaffold protein [Candidatus Woesebacteria bacterium CG_4_10_14_0_2_um_filter_39_14]PJA49527.1 MAG: iron-sulfur cluster assembly scaffold protein [Candidatus Shapirobacteria bacterium CG_4_9_14_3_um_filter_39_13]